jgi:hypothetical protein
MPVFLLMGFSDAEGIRVGGRLRDRETDGGVTLHLDPSSSQRAGIIGKARAARPTKGVWLGFNYDPLTALQEIGDTSCSVRRSIRLGRFMPSPRRHPPHPLLFEQEYWRNRLRSLKLARPSALYTPRPDLSSRSVRVEEFRVKAHDGLRLCGLHGRRAMAIGASRVRLRVLSPDRIPEIDLPAVRSGVVEYVLRFPAGRRLEDRVLDVLRVSELAAAKENVAATEVLLYSPEGEAEPDEFLIVSQLRSGELEHESD